MRLRPWIKTLMKVAVWCGTVLAPCDIYNNGSKEDHILILESLHMYPRRHRGHAGVTKEHEMEGYPELSGQV